MKRLELVRECRFKSPTTSVRRDADTPALFTQIWKPITNFLVVPKVSGENRKYIPIGFMTPDVIVSNYAHFHLPLSKCSLMHFASWNANFS